MKKSISRRTFLKLSSLAASSLCFDSNSFGMNKTLNSRDDNYRFNLGGFECICFNDGGLDYNPSDFFKNVPTEKLNEVLNKQKLPLDSIYTP